MFNGVDFNGTIRVGTQHDDDFIGLVFSYQNNRQFYLISWKQSDQVYWEMKPFRASAIRGIQMKVILTRVKECVGVKGLSCRLGAYPGFWIFFFQLVDSETGPGFDLRNALWHSGDVEGQVSGQMICLFFLSLTHLTPMRKFFLRNLSKDSKPIYHCIKLGLKINGVISLLIYYIVTCLQLRLKKEQTFYYRQL